MPSTMLLNSSPYCSMAALRALISLSKEASPPEAHRPRSREVLVLMAAGMAEMGSLAVPACWMIRLVRPDFWVCRVGAYTI